MTGARDRSRADYLTSVSPDLYAYPITSPSSATRYHPCLSESAHTVSPGISTAESSAFGLGRLRTWVHVRATSSRPVSAAAGATAVLGVAASGSTDRRAVDA